ncbi:MAG: hypothetical protein ACI8YQ_001631 [Polaribacter sp.]|jgi:hypothetical protein
MNNYLNIFLLIGLIFFFFYSCNYYDREVIVDKSKLLGNDYRLFQQTEAWELAKAVADQNVKQINKLIREDKELIDFQEPVFGQTLLMLTIVNQQFKSFKTLLENGANVNLYGTYDGSSALIDACGYDHYDVKYPKLLFQYGANINDLEVGPRQKRNETRYTPLIAASRAGNIKIVKFLVENGADVNFQNEYKQSALSKAALTGKYDVVYYLLKNGADFRRPVFYREDKDKKIYLEDILNRNTNPSDRKYKKKIISFLRANE